MGQHLTVPRADRSDDQNPEQPNSSRFQAGSQSTQNSADGKTPAPCSLRDACEDPSLQPMQTTACESPSICDTASVDALEVAAAALPRPVASNSGSSEPSSDTAEINAVEDKAAASLPGSVAPNSGSPEPSSDAAEIDAAEDLDDSLSAASIHDAHLSPMTVLSETAFPHICFIPPSWPEGCGEAHIGDSASASIAKDMSPLPDASTKAHESTQLLAMPPQVAPEETTSRTRCYRWSDDITSSTHMVCLSCSDSGSDHDQEQPNAPVGAPECLVECGTIQADGDVSCAQIAWETPTSEVFEVTEQFSNSMGGESATHAGGDVSSAQMAQGMRTEYSNAPVGAPKCLNECGNIRAGEFANSAQSAQETPTSEVSEVTKPLSNPIGREVATKAGSDVGSARITQGTRAHNATCSSKSDIYSDCLNSELNETFDEIEADVHATLPEMTRTPSRVASGVTTPVMPAADARTGLDSLNNTKLSQPMQDHNATCNFQPLDVPAVATAGIDGDPIHVAAKTDALNAPGNSVAQSVPCTPSAEDPMFWGEAEEWEERLFTHDNGVNPCSAVETSLSTKSMYEIVSTTQYSVLATAVRSVPVSVYATTVASVPVSVLTTQCSVSTVSCLQCLIPALYLMRVRYKLHWTKREPWP